VPKDTKRFINPLLRSSQENAPAPTLPKPDPAPQPQPIPVEEERQSEEVQDSLALQSETSVDVAASNLSSEDVVQPQVTSKEAASKKRHSPSSSAASHSRREERAEEKTQEQQDQYAEMDSNRASETIPSLSSSPALPVPVTSDQTILSVESGSEVISLTDSQEVTQQRETTSSRRRRHSFSEAEVPNEAVVTDADPLVENLDQPRSIPHRRHGTQTFEATHERITLWIDRQLKQNFEALAYDRSLSKTKLLNEAIAELLKKYGVR
jgi:hypothetical protein